MFELVYFARPDSTVFGESVDRARRELGRQLAREQPAPRGEVVFSVPDSSNAMALGFSEVSGTKLEYGLIRNHYVGRTFINPTQALRVAKVKIKFNPVREVIEGRSVVMVDDSLVRGTTSKGLVQMVRAAGAKEVHLRLGSPPITGPCHYGIDTPTREELIGATHSVEEIREFLGVDSLGYLSLDGMLDAAGRGTGFCHACFSGQYPTPITEELVQLRHAAPRRHARMSGSFTPPLVYFFGQGRADGTAAMKEVLGGKGAGLAEMTTLGIPVPPGFTITTTICLQYLEAKQFSPRSRRRSSRRSSGSRMRPAAPSVIGPTRCSSPCAPALRCRCPA